MNPRSSARIKIILGLVSLIVFESGPSCQLEDPTDKTGVVIFKIFGNAHTTGDAAVYLRDSNVLHMGDVFNMSGPPFVDADNGGSIDGIIRFCEEILKVVNDETIVVPGHGPISTTGDIQTYIDMLIVVRDRIRSLIEEGKTLEEILASDPSKEWREKFGEGPFIQGVIDRAYAGMIK